MSRGDLRVGIIMIFLFISVRSVYSQEPLFPLRTENPPLIDGILDDEVWQRAPYETGFITYLPDYGREMADNTQVWYAYDRENLYFAFRCFDSEPNKIKASVSSRDKIRPDDWICLNLDTFNDHQSIYALYVNPLGIQMDSRATAVAEDMSIDVVWYSEGIIDEQGYSIEIKIPFKSIRFSHKEPVEMGIIFERYISRKSEAGTYPALDPKHGPNFLTQTRPLIYNDVKHYRLFEVLPAVTYGTGSEIDEGKLISAGDESDISLTAKFGITSHWVLDGTYNPDFSQVEADAGQVDFNQRYALFYPEKRPFFLEGRENFAFGGSTEGDPLGAVVHTRTILDPLAGVKLTGKIGQNNTLATIYALDELPEDLQQGDVAHVVIMRYKRALAKDSFLGTFFTGRERDQGFNRILGGDGGIRLNQSSMVGFHGFFSQNRVSPDSTKYNGYAVGTNYVYNTRDWLINIRLHDLSSDFHTETGYVTRTGITRIRAGLLRMVYPKSSFFLRIDPLLNNQFIWDKESQLWEHSNAVYLTFLLPRMTGIRIGYDYSDEVFLGEKFDTGGLRFYLHSQFTRQLYFDVIYNYGKKIRYSEDPFQGRGSTTASNIVYQPSDKLQSSFSLSYSDLYKNVNGNKIFDYTIIRSKNTYQLNKYLFFRAIIEYNSFHKEFLTDFLASFTYIPGTVIHIGYGSLYDRTAWREDHYEDSDRFLEVKRGFFFKASYLWRL